MVFTGVWKELGYLKLLQDGAADTGWDLDSPEYEAREIKNRTLNSKSINVTNFQPEHYKEELEYFLKTGDEYCCKNKAEASTITPIL